MILNFDDDVFQCWGRSVLMKLTEVLLPRQTRHPRRISKVISSRGSF
jgi:hypothetical protein